MKKLLFLAVLLCSMISSSWSQKIISHKDSILIEIQEYPLKLYKHEVVKGETLFSLSKYFGMSVDGMLNFNPQLKTADLSVGDEVKIPIPSRAIRRYKGKTFQRWQYAPIFYKVKKGDNLYRISKGFFRMPVDTVLSRNGLEATEIKEGQLLNIGWFSTKGIPDSIQYNSGKVVNNYKNRRSFLKQSLANLDSLSFQQNGAAEWKQVNVHNNKFFALHNTAAKGSVLAVKNPMNNRIAYVEVIGKIPIIYNEPIVILSAAAAKYLGAKDARFYIEIAFADQQTAAIKSD